MSSLHDTSIEVQRLAAADPLREPVLRSIVEGLQLPSGSHGLDAGCGIGRQAILLAEAIGPAGHVSGVDISSQALAYAGQLVGERGLARRIALRQADVHRLPFPDATFDWAWSADCVGYPASDRPTALRELARVVRPGGTVLLLGWTSQCLLPGYALLEARLNAACSAYAPYLRAAPPATYFARSLGALRDAGLVDIEARSFVGDLQAPLSQQVRRALAALFEMLWDLRQPGLSDQDRRDAERLCAPESPECVLDLADYYGFFTYTLVRGTRPATARDHRR